MLLSTGGIGSAKVVLDDDQANAGGLTKGHVLITPQCRAEFSTRPSPTNCVLSPVISTVRIDRCGRFARAGQPAPPALGLTGARTDWQANPTNYVAP